MLVFSQPVSLEAAQAEFLQQYPEFATTAFLDDLRASDYARLDKGDHVYLDYTGGGLYAESQIRTHLEFLSSGVFGNPHSNNPASQPMNEHVDKARASVLEFFSASPEEYAVVFTPNASGALKLVGESYPFGPGGLYLLTFDNHNSVNGIREFAKAKGAQVIYTPVLPPDLLIDEARLAANLGRAGQGGPSLFAYPAQSNFSGVQHSLEWIDRAQAHGWDVLLDAAAFVPANRLDLSRWHPDFVSISFYKIFGYPTGVGCLLARKTALKKLLRPWFSGGTITVASVQAGRYYLQEGPEAFEDGTLNYLALPAVEIGLRHIEKIGVGNIHTRVRCLTGWLIGELQPMTHSNGNAIVRIYGPLDTRSRGGTVTMNFYDPQGRFVDHELVERRASEHRISLRTGCFCNPGDGELALEISTDELTACFVSSKERLSRDDFRRCMDAKSTGAVRVSMGLVTDFSDAFRFLHFTRSFLDKNSGEI
jgi:selenocysteine lyase/cysteine desulfurase